jgi:DNA-binding NarL/FixJ family response regulator
MSGRVRIVLVEDNQTFRDTLELLLGLREEVEVVGAVDNGTDAPALVQRLQPDVVLLDYRLPA